MADSSEAYLRIERGEDGSRLDRVLLRLLGEARRPLILRLIRKGNVRVNGKRSKPQTRLHAGDRVFLPASLRPSSVSETRASRAAPHGPAPTVLYEDADILVIDKPAGVVVHGGSGHEHGLIDRLRWQYGDEDLRLAHRLDRDTSGCLLVARHLAALRPLSEQFRRREAEKTYLAWVAGVPQERAGRIRESLRKGRLRGGERMVASDIDGQSASTDFQLIMHMDWQGMPVSLLALWPHSGRTHQLRVHMRQEGCPILGDGKYGEREAWRDFRQRGGRGLCLHAWRLRFLHPVNGRAMEVRAPLPLSWSVFRESR